jgi:tripartite-type tricarboxylate transporter receptor subunit TctC
VHQPADSAGWNEGEEIMRKSVVGLALAGILVCSGQAIAQDYPNHPISLIIPFAAGGPTDVLGRVIGQAMGGILGQQIVIENVGGAGGMIGASRVKQAAPDGYTFGLGTVGTHAQNQTLYKKPLYQAETDFTPVVLMAELPLVLIVRKDLPVSNLKEFVAYAKASQDKMQFGSAGAGSATHMGCLLLNYVLGTTVTHVPYPGTGPAMSDLIGGRIDFLCEIITTAKPQIDGNAVKAIAIMTKTRSPALPNVPTTAEQGLPTLEAYTWNAFFLPKGTPAEIVKKLNDATVKAMKDPSVRARLEGLGAVFVSDDRTTPAYLASFVHSEVEKWATPIKASGFVVE